MATATCWRIHAHNGLKAANLRLPSTYHHQGVQEAGSHLEGPFIDFYERAGRMGLGGEGGNIQAGQRAKI